MKRVLALALCLMLCAGMLIGCAGDGTDANHVHTFDYSKWSYDANGHWFNSTCDCEVVTEEKLKHVDENKDGACDACKYVYECKDGHTYSEEWAADCTNHFKLANCGHVTAPYALAAHADANGDGVCDTCAYVIEDLHEHYYDSAWSGDAEYHWHAALCEHGVEVADKAAHEINAAGYCTVCEAKINEIDKTDIGAILAAAVAQNGKVVDGNVIAGQLVYGASGIETAQTNEVYYVLGETDSYIFYKTYGMDGEFLGGDHQWYEGISEDEVFAVQMVAGSNTLEVVTGDAQFLNGYTYQPGGILPGIDVDTSTLANTLYAIYGIAEAGVNVEAFEESYDAETGVYSVLFRYLLVNETHMSDDTTEYQAYLYGVAIEFTVDELGVIDRADFAVSSWRNWELDNDLTYNPADGSYVLHDDATPSIYAYSVSQRSGERTYTTIYPRASLVPTDFELSYVTGTDFMDSGEMYITNEEPIVDSNDDGILDLTLAKDEYVRLHLSSLVPYSALASALNINDFSMTYVNNTADATGVLWKDVDTHRPGYSQYMDCITFKVADPGEYTVNINFGDISKTLIITVPADQGLVIPENTATKYYVVTTDTYGWEDAYTFTAPAEGAYTFTVPAGLGLWIDGAQAPAVDFYLDPNGGYANFELEAGASISFTVSAATKNVVWEIGVAFVACEVEGGSGSGEGGGETGGSIAADISGVYYTADGVLTINNDGTMTYEVGGRTHTYTYAIEGGNVTYTYNGNDPYDKNAMMAPYFGYLEFGTEGMPSAFVYNGQTLPLSTTAPGGGNEGGDTPGGEGGDTPGGEDPAPTLPILVLGENTVVIEEADIENGKDYSLIVSEEGNFTIAGDLLAIFIDESGMQLGRGQAYLTAGTYTVKFINIMAAEGTFTVTLSYAAPEGEGEGNGTEANPYVWDELPESVTIDSDTSNMIYYLYTATENGTITLTWVSGDSWGNWFEMDGTNTTANNGSASMGSEMSFTVEAGKTYRIGLGTFYVAGEFVINVDFTAGSGDEGGDEGGEEGGDEITVKGPLYDGYENEIEVTADDKAAGKFYLSFMPDNDGEYEFASNDLFVSAVTLDGVAIEKNNMGKYVLESYVYYVLEVSTAYIYGGAGTYALTPEYTYPEGHQENPFWYTLGENATASYKNDYNTIWYSFYADATGTLTVTNLSEYTNVELLACAIFGFENTSVVYDDETWESTYGSTVTIQVMKGRQYFIGISGGALESEAEIEFTASIEEGEITADGTATLPYPIVMGDTVSSIVDGEAVYYYYTFTEAGTLTLTTASDNCAWYYAEDLSEYLDPMTETTLVIEGYVGYTVFLCVNTANWGSEDITVNASFKADPVEIWYEAPVITDGSAANDIVLQENSYVAINLFGRGSYVISWDNTSAIVEMVSFWMGNTPILNGGVIECDPYGGSTIAIYLPEYAAGTVKLTITPYVAPSQDVVIGDNTVSVTDTNDGNSVTFTAPEAGTYTFSTDANGVIIYNYSPYVNGNALVVELTEGESITFNVATYDFTMSDVTLSVSVSTQEGGNQGASQVLSGSFKYVYASNCRYVLEFKDDGTGKLKEQEFANLSWGTLTSTWFTYSFDGTYVTIDFDDTAVCGDGTYAVVDDYIVGVAYNDTTANFELIT